MTNLISRHSALHLETAKRLANPQNVREPGVWLSKIEEVEQVLAQGGPAEKIVALYSAYCLAQVHGLTEVLAISASGRSPLDRPPLPLIYDLRGALAEGLDLLGIEATDSLLKTYQDAPPGASNRSAILSRLAMTGDPELKQFFHDLQESDIYPTVAEERKRQQSYSVYFPDAPSTPDAEPSVEEESRQFLSAILHCYEQALNESGNCDSNLP